MTITENRINWIINKKNSGSKSQEMDIKKDFIKQLVKYTIEDKIIKETRKILGPHFNGLYSHFCNYFFKFNCNTYTVMIVRRCPVHSMWYFKLIFEKLKDTIENKFEIFISENGLLTIRNKETKIENIIINDKFLDSGYIFNLNYKFVVLDDISIHGRHLCEVASHIDEVANNLRKILNEDDYRFATKLNIKKIVYMSSEDSVINYPDDATIKVKGSSWKTLSNSIVDSINYLNLPYVSSLNTYTSFYFDSNKFESMIKKLTSSDSLICKEFSTVRQEGLGKVSYLIFEKECNLLYKEKLKCIRIYYSKKNEVLTFIPYTSFDNLSVGNLNLCFRNYLKEGKIRKEDEDRINKEECIEYNSKLLSFIASDIYGKYFMNRYLKICPKEFEKNGLIEDYYNALTLTFGLLRKKYYLNYDIYNEQVFETEQAKIHVSNDIIKELDQANNENKNEVESLLLKLWIENEKNACYLLGKTDKIDLNSLIKHNKEKEKINWTNFIDVIRSCDNGVASVVEEKDNIGNCKSYLDVGELGVNLVGRTELYDEFVEDDIHALKQCSIYYKNLF